MASVDTLQRWIKETFAETNLIENFISHSCRSASTTIAFSVNLDIFDILILNIQPVGAMLKYFCNIIKRKSFVTKEYIFP